MENTANKNVVVSNNIGRTAIKKCNLVTLVISEIVR